MKTKEKSEEELGTEASNKARQQTLDALNKQGVTLELTIRRLKQAMNAKEVRVFNDKEDGIVYSKHLVAHGIRLRAVEIALDLHEAKPRQKHDVNHNMDESVMSLVAAHLNKKKNGGKEDV